MKKVLMALTNVDHYADHPERKTGVWLEEAAGFYDVLTTAGITVDFASDQGGAVPIDPASREADEATMKVVNDSAFKKGMNNTVPFSEIKSEDYDAVYFCGGHGAMWDFPDNTTLQTIAQDIYRKGGFIASVCHGEAGLVNLKDADGSPLVKGKHVNGFTDEEEKINGTDQLVPLSPEQELIKDGAIFEKGKAYTEFAVSDQRFITGQNPMSCRKVARLLVNELQGK